MKAFSSSRKNKQAAAPSSSPPPPVELHKKLSVFSVQVGVVILPGKGQVYTGGGGGGGGGDAFNNMTKEAGLVKKQKRFLF